MNVLSSSLAAPKTVLILKEAINVVASMDTHWTAMEGLALVTDYG